MAQETRLGIPKRGVIHKDARRSGADSTVTAGCPPLGVRSAARVNKFVVGGPNFLFRIGVFLRSSSVLYVGVPLCFTWGPDVLRGAPGRFRTLYSYLVFFWLLGLFSFPRWAARCFPGALVCELFSFAAAIFRSAPRAPYPGTRALYPRPRVCELLFLFRRFCSVCAAGTFYFPTGISFWSSPRAFYLGPRVPSIFSAGLFVCAPGTFIFLLGFFGLRTGYFTRRSVFFLLGARVA